MGKHRIAGLASIHRQRTWGFEWPNFNLSLVGPLSSHPSPSNLGETHRTHRKELPSSYPASMGFDASLPHQSHSQLWPLPIPVFPSLLPLILSTAFLPGPFFSHLCCLVIALGAFWVSEIPLTGPWKKLRTHFSWRKGHGKHSGISKWKQERTCPVLLQAERRVAWIRYLFNIRLSCFN